MGPERVLKVDELVTCMRQVWESFFSIYNPGTSGNCAWMRIPPLSPIFWGGFVSIYNISWFLTPLSKLLNLHSR